MPIFREAVPYIAALLLFFGVGPASASLIRTENPDDNQGLGIKQTVPVTFPSGLLLQGVPTGKVGIVISVDATGKLVDQLVVAYTNKAFAKAVLEAVSQWTYEPAKVRGRARASRVDLTFIFKSDLNVMVQSNANAFMQDFLGERNEFQPCGLNELDRIPTPVNVVSPPIPEGVLAPGEERVVNVEFYIDQEGKVRMPAVSREEADDKLAAAAVGVVEAWRFEPPLRKKQPVLVLAQQEFRFMAKAKTISKPN